MCYAPRTTHRAKPRAPASPRPIADWLSAMGRRLWRAPQALGILLVLLSLALTACGPADAAGDMGLGGSSPEAVVEDFVEDLNEALQDTTLRAPETRQRWADRLASYFAPSERADQRLAMREMLDNFVASSRRPVIGERITFELTHNGMERITSSADEALVRVVDGTLVVRWLDAEGQVLRERIGGLTDVIGQTSGGLPVLRVDGVWFLTEG